MWPTCGLNLSRVSRAAESSWSLSELYEWPRYFNVEPITSFAPSRTEILPLKLGAISKKSFHELMPDLTLSLRKPKPVVPQSLGMLYLLPKSYPDWVNLESMWL